MEPRPVVFVLYNLNVDSQDLEVDDMALNIQNYSEEVAGSYCMSLQAILGSSLNRSGMVHSVYLNCFDNGCFQLLNPQAYTYDNVTPVIFQAALPTMFTTRRLVNPNLGTWGEVHNILAELPPNRRIIGCLSGGATPNARQLRDYVAMPIPAPTTPVFMVGAFEDGVLRGHIQDHVNLSSYQLTPSTAIYRICESLHQQWNIL